MMLVNFLTERILLTHLKMLGNGVVQVVLSAWGVAEAGAIHPDHLNAWTSNSKKTLTALRSWTFIRATGRYPPEGETPGQAASESDKEWAAKPFEDF